MSLDLFLDNYVIIPWLYGYRSVDEKKAFQELLNRSDQELVMCFRDQAHSLLSEDNNDFYRRKLAKGMDLLIRVLKYRGSCILRQHCPFHGPGCKERDFLECRWFNCIYSDYPEYCLKKKFELEMRSRT